MVRQDWLALRLQSVRRIWPSPQSTGSYVSALHEGFEFRPIWPHLEHRAETGGVGGYAVVRPIVLGYLKGSVAFSEMPLVVAN